jgi:4-amino-4-deoxy-L-arabinose transferase-like glycosyltransferase
MATDALKKPVSWLISKRYDLLLILILTVVGASLRSTGIPHGVGFHPDERHMVQVTEKLEAQHMNPKSFAYGSFSFYAAWGFAKLFALFSKNAFSYDGLFFSGRVFCTVMGALTIPLVYYLCLLLYQRSAVGLVAATLMAVNVFHLQLSRFFTSDVTLTTLSLISIIALVKAYEKGTLASYLVFGFCAGLAAATKISSAFLFVPLFFVVSISTLRDWGRLKSWNKPLTCLAIGIGAVALTVLADMLLFWKGYPRIYKQRLMPLPTLIPLSVPFVALAALALRSVSKPLSQLGAAITLGIAVFVLAEPYAIIDFETFSRHTQEQTAMVQGKWRPPYTIQYAHTVPYFYHLKQMLWYTMGWPIFIAGLVGVVVACLRFVLDFLDKIFKRQFLTSPFSPEFIPLIFMAVFFVATARFQVKFPRYLLPLYPMFFVFAASVLTPRQRRKRVAAAAAPTPQPAPVPAEQPLTESGAETSAQEP